MSNGRFLLVVMTTAAFIGAALVGVQMAVLGYDGVLEGALVGALLGVGTALFTIST